LNWYSSKSVRQLEGFRSVRKWNGFRIWYRQGVREQFDFRVLIPQLCGKRIAANDNTGLLKSGRRIEVYQLQNFQPPLIVKAFPLSALKFKLKYKKYALSEMCNNLQAEKTGLRVPACYLYFEERPWGLVNRCGVVMEKLQGYRDLADWAGEEKSHLYHAIDAIIDLYKRGVNHIDPSPFNIFWNPAECCTAIIDWQYCGFTELGDDRQLLLHAAHFVRVAKHDAGLEDSQAWLAKLHEQSKTGMDWAIFEKDVAKIIQMMDNKQLSTEDRLKLKLGI